MLVGLGILQSKNSSQATSENDAKSLNRDTAAVSGSPILDVTAIKEQDFGDPNYDPTVYWERPLRPFPVSIKSANYEWTDVDGRDPAIMKQIANNAVMLESLETDNLYITKRQLIYVPEEFKQVAQGIYDGEVTEFPLPGFDGAEIPVVVTQFENMENQSEHDGPLTGAWSGYLKDDPSISVFAGSQNNYWTINYVQDGVRYEYNNREEGEWILADINLAGEAHVHGEGCGNHCTHGHLAEATSQPITSTAEEDSKP